MAEKSIQKPRYNSQDSMSVGQLLRQRLFNIRSHVLLKTPMCIGNTNKYFAARGPRVAI